MQMHYVVLEILTEFWSVIYTSSKASWC